MLRNAKSAGFGLFPLFYTYRILVAIGPVSRRSQQRPAHAQHPMAARQFADQAVVIARPVCQFADDFHRLEADPDGLETTLPDVCWQVVCPSHDVQRRLMRAESATGWWCAMSAVAGWRASVPS